MLRDPSRATSHHQLHANELAGGTSHVVEWRYPLAGWACHASSCDFFTSTICIACLSSSDSRRDRLPSPRGAPPVLYRQRVLLHHAVAFPIRDERSLRSLCRLCSIDSHDSRFVARDSLCGRADRRHTATDRVRRRACLPATACMIPCCFRHDSVLPPVRSRAKPIRSSIRVLRSPIHAVRCLICTMQ